MTEETTIKIPDPKPGMFVWFGRFKNRAGIITDVRREGETLKVEIEPVPKGRKKSKTRNLLPYRLMNEEDSAKFKKIYDEETEQLRKKKAAVASRYRTAQASQFVEDDDPAGITVWASEDGMCRIQDMGSGPQRFQSLHRSGSVWCEDMGWPSLKAALRDLRRIGGTQ
jgi:hypothetical protein